MYSVTPSQTANLIAKVQDVAKTYLQTLQVEIYTNETCKQTPMLTEHSGTPIHFLLCQYLHLKIKTFLEISVSLYIFGYAENSKFSKIHVFHAAIFLKRNIITIQK